MTVYDLWSKKGPDGEKIPSARYGRGKRWRVQCVDPDGKPVTQSFVKKGDADRFDLKIRSDVARGEYVDPGARRVTLFEYGEGWRAMQPHRANTADRHQVQLHKHVYTAAWANDRPISAIRPSDVQAWVTRLDMAPSSARVIYNTLRAIFSAAVRDRIVTFHPCQGIKLPELPVAQVVPLTVTEVEALADAIDRRYRALVVFGAASGLRQGELFGLQVGDVDFLRREVKVQRQVQVGRGVGPAVCPLKTRTSYRTVPVGAVAIEALAAHLAAYRATGAEFVFRDRAGHLLHKGTFNAGVWHPARRAVDLPTADCHDLRHFYASALIRSGMNAKVVAARLGHADAAMTWKVYAHLWPDDEDRSRQAIDDVFSMGVHDRLRSVP